MLWLAVAKGKKEASPVELNRGCRRALIYAPGTSFAQQAVQRTIGGIAGTALSRGAAGIPTTQIPVALGTGHLGAGTGGVSQGVGNATGGIVPSTISGSGGTADGAGLGTLTGGIRGSGRGINAGTGGIADLANSGGNTGGITGSQIGAGTGGIGNLQSLGSDTGGIVGGNAPRFQLAH